MTWREQTGHSLRMTTGGRPAGRCSRSGVTAVSLCLLLLLCGSTLRAGEPNCPCGEDLGNAPALVDQRYSVMSTVLRRGFLFVEVDVASVVIRFGKDTAGQLRRLAEGKTPSPAIDQEISVAAIDSKNALVEVTFDRDITLKRFIDEARRNTEQVWKAGVIDKQSYERIHKLLPLWYAALAGRGVKRDDRMCSRIVGEKLHTLYLGRDGKVFVDQINDGDSACLAVLGAYFVKGSEFREGLIKSLF